jgi:hypothetical protein
VRVVLVCPALLAFAAAPAAGAEYDTIPFEAHAADGAALRGHVYLPRGAPRPLATVLEPC